MQTLTDDDRTALTASSITVDYGCDVLDDAGNVIDDLTPDLEGCEVSHNAYNAVHRTATVNCTRALDWPAVWLRPWQSVTGGGKTARFDVGVFRPAIPEAPMGAQPLVYEVKCADRLSLLQRIIGDTRVSPAPNVVLSEVARVIGESQAPGAILVDSTLNAAVLATDMVWMLTPDSPDSYLRWVNDLLAAINYRGIFMSSDGDFMVQQYRPPEQRPSEWTFDIGDDGTNIVEPNRSSTTDGYTGLNWWRFIRNGMTYQPTEGDGLYTVDRSGGGVQNRKVAALDAVDQDTLVAQGDAIVEQDTTVTQTIEITTGPMPCLGHFDVVTYVDPEMGSTPLHCQMASWTLNLAATQGATDIVLEVPSG